MKTLLIADDDPILLRRIERVAEDHADVIGTVAVPDGKAAIEALGNHRISLLITDIHMPEVNGLELLAYVNTHHPAIPCFVMTAYDSPTIQKKLPRDLVRYFRKPVDPHELIETAIDVLGQDTPRGLIRGISITSFVYMITMEKKTCLLEVVLGDNDKGLLYFEKGVIFDASYKGGRGETAAIDILSQRKASFRFRPVPDRKLARRVDSDLTELLAEANQRRETVVKVDWDDILT